MRRLLHKLLVAMCSYGDGCTAIGGDKKQKVLFYFFIFYFFFF